GLQRGAGRDERLEPDVALHRDDGAGARARQPVHRLRDLLGHRLAVALREAAHQAGLAEPGEGVAQLGLEHHDRGERAVREDESEQVADHRELREHRHEVAHREDHQPDDDLHRPRPHEEEEEAVDDERDEQDLDDVRPEPRDEKPIRFEVHGALFVAAHATARASRASATSWTRKRRAPRSQASAQATAVARSRSSTGRPVAAPRNRLRDGPTATGYPSPAIVASSSSKRRLGAGVLANPNPGSTTMRSRGTPAFPARPAAPPSSAAISGATSV